MRMRGNRSLSRDLETSQSGASLVEFSIIAPVLLLLAFACIDIATAINRKTLLLKTFSETLLTSARKPAWAPGSGIIGDDAFLAHMTYAQCAQNITTSLQNQLRADSFLRSVQSTQLVVNIFQPIETLPETGNEFQTRRIGVYFQGKLPCTLLCRLTPALFASEISISVPYQDAKNCSIVGNNTPPID